MTVRTLTIFLLLSILTSSCMKTVYIVKYHHFTNEFDIVGTVEVPTVEVYNQIYGNTLHVTMVNTGDEAIYFYPPTSSLKINNYTHTLGELKKSSEIRPGGSEQIKFDLNRLMNEAQIDLTKEGDVRLTLNLGLSDANLSEYYVNTYKLQKQAIDTHRKSVKGRMQWP